MGVSAEWGILRNRRLGLLTEVLYIEKGLESRRTTYSASHLAFPVLAKLSLAAWPVIPHLLAGPSFEVVVEDPGRGYEDDRFVLGFQVGGGVTWRDFAAEVRYARDQTQMVDVGYFGTESRASGGWLFLLGWQVSPDLGNRSGGRAP